MSDDRETIPDGIRAVSADEAERAAYVQRAEFAEQRLTYFEALAKDNAKTIGELTAKIAKLEDEAQPAAAEPVPPGTPIEGL